MSKLEVDAIEPQSGTTLTIGASGDSVTLGSGASLTSPGLTLSDNILFNAASKGIYLGVTTPTASNLLDDYEEGTFTATLTADTPPTSPPTSTGYYTKIGNLVYVNVYFRGVSTVGASGEATITGLPFTSTATNRTYGALWELNTLVGTDNASSINLSASEIKFIQPDTGNLTDIIANTGRYLQTSILYFTDA